MVGHQSNHKTCQMSHLEALYLRTNTGIGFDIESFALLMSKYLRVNGSVVEFAFYRQSCFQNAYTNDALGKSSIGVIYRIVSGNPYDLCLPSNGASGTSSILTSSKNITSLVNALKTSSSITMEFWIQPSQTASTDSTIFAIGSPSYSNTVNNCNYNLKVMRIVTT